MKKNKRSKLLRFFITTIMCCSIFGGTGAYASTSENEYVLVSTEEELRAALTVEVNKAAYVSLQSDIKIGETLKVNKANIKLNGYSISSNTKTVIDVNVNGRLQIDGDKGSIYIENNVSRGQVAITTQNGSNLYVNDTTVTGGNGTITGGQGILNYNASNSYINNSIISSGNSAFNKFANCAIENVVGNIYINNSTFTKGTGTQTKGYDLISLIRDNGFVPGKLYDFNENQLQVPDYKVSSVTFKDDMFVREETAIPVTANASIPAPTYTITIPELIDLGTQNQALEKYRNEKVDQYGNQVQVSSEFNLKGENIDNLFNDLGFEDRVDLSISYSGELGSERKIPYTITKDEKAYESDTIFCSFINSDEAIGEQVFNGKITINRADIKKTGNYTGTMTFNLSIPVKN
ncbi:MAG: hypothetical protein RR128_08415, partial [Clostridium sp.]